MPTLLSKVYIIDLLRYKKAFKCEQVFYFSLLIICVFNTGLTEQGDGLREVEEEPTVHGTVKIKLQQTFKGIDVFGDEVVVERNGNQLTPEVEGEMVEGLQAEVPDVTPKISKTDAFSIAIKKWMSATKDFDPSDAKYDLHDDIKLAIYDDKDTPFRLVYILSFLVDTEANLTRPLCVINALTGDVTSCFEQIGE